MTLAFAPKTPMDSVQPRQSFTVITEPPFARGWSMEPHAHIQHEIALVKSGTCDIILGNGESRLLVENTAFFVPSGVSHGFKSREGVEFIVVQFIHMDDELRSQLVNNYPIGQYMLSSLEKSQLADLCFRLQRELASNLPYTMLQCRSLIDQIIVLLLRCDARYNSPDLTSEQRQLIEAALEYMHKNVANQLLIRDVAEYVGLSEAHLRLLFRRMTGTSPKQYLLALRLQASKCLLMHANTTVTQVALIAGFTSPQEFSKIFRRFTGLTPSEWRRAYLFT